MKKTKKLCRWINDDIYGQSFHLFVNYNSEEIKQVLDKKYDMTTKDIKLLGKDTNTGSLIRLQVEGIGIFAMRFNFENATSSDYICNIIAHEVCHHVLEGLSDIGMEISNESEEAYAYYTGYITQKIYKELKGFIK